MIDRIDSGQLWTPGEVIKKNRRFHILTKPKDKQK